MRPQQAATTAFRFEKIAFRELILSAFALTRFVFVFQISVLEIFFGTNSENFKFQNVVESKHHMTYVGVGARVQHYFQMNHFKRFLLDR